MGNWIDPGLWEACVSQTPGLEIIWDPDFGAVASIRDADGEIIATGADNG